MTKNYLYNLSLSLVNILFPILSFPYASHLLGPVGIGKVQFISSFAQYFALIAALGIPIYGVKETAKCRDHKASLTTIFSELSLIFIITSVLLSAIYIALLFIFPYFHADRALYTYATLLILLAFTYTDWFYSGIEEFKAIALRSISIKAVSLLMLYLLVKTADDYKNYLFITLFSILGNNIISFLIATGRFGFRLSGLGLKRHLQPLFYIFSTTIAGSIYTVLDTVLLGFLSSEKAVGLYTAAVKLTKITLPVVTSMGVVLIPQIARSLASNNEEETARLLNRAFQFISFFSVPIGAGLALLAPEFLVVFSGSKFVPATVSMQILSLLPLLIGLGHFFAFLILVPGGKNKEMFLSVIGGVVIGLVLNFLLVPPFSETGAAIANMCTELAVTLFYIRFVKKHYAFRYQWHLLWKAMVCVSIFIPIVLLIRKFFPGMTLVLVLAVPSCAIAYVAAQWFIFKNQFIFDIREFLYAKISGKKSSVE